MIPSGYGPITVAGNGVLTQFSFNFPVPSASDFTVIYTNASGAETALLPTQYTIALSPVLPGSLWPNGGVLTYPLSGSPIANGTTLTIYREVPLTQETALSNQGNFYPAAVEEALDTLCMELQQVSARTGQIRGTWIALTGYNYSDIVIDGVNGNDTGNIYLCTKPNISGVWATDLANGFWAIGLNVQGIINSLPAIASHSLFGNITGSTATPVGVGGSAFLDAVFGSTQGSLLYRSASVWTALTPGTSGQVLTAQGSAANPHWANSTSGGTVTSVATGAGLTGGPINGAGTVALASTADMTLLANVSGGSAAPGASTLSAILDYILGNTQGNIIFRGGTTWGVLGPGTAGQLLKTGGAGANPSWGTYLTALNNSLSGNVSTNNASNYFDGPTVAQGSSGTWFAVGTVTVTDSAGAQAFFVKLWDGTTVIDSGQALTTGAGAVVSLSLGGYISSPAGNIRMSVREPNATTGSMLSNQTGTSKDCTVSVFRIG